MTILSYNEKDFIDRSLKSKMVFEASLSNKLNRLFKSVSSEVYQAYVSYGLPYFPPEFDEQLADILLASYRNSGRYYARFNSEYLTNGRSWDKKKIYSETLVKLDPLFKDRSLTSAAFIKATTLKELSSAVEMYVQAANEEGLETDRRKIAALIKGVLEQRAPIRSVAIAFTETTWATEVAKGEEISSILDNAPDDALEELVPEDATDEERNSILTMGLAAAIAAGLIEARKTWYSIRDNRTRFFHAIAHGQTVALSNPFIVGGEPLMMPGVGGSIGNTIHCRCVVGYSL